MRLQSAGNTGPKRSANLDGIDEREIQWVRLHLESAGPSRLRVHKTAALHALRGFFLGVGQVLFVGALEVFDFAAFEMPDASGDFIDYVVVVSY